MRDLLFGTPVGWQLDVWLALGSIPLWVLVALAMAPLGWFTGRGINRRRQARWPDGKP
jgi:hypothetical protein